MRDELVGAFLEQFQHLLVGHGLRRRRRGCWRDRRGCLCAAACDCRFHIRLHHAATRTSALNGGNIDAAYGNLPAATYICEQNTARAIVCQIENDAALAEVEAIAATPGVEALFFGPGDYAASRGEAGQITSPAVVEAWGRVSRAARAAGKAWGTVAVGSGLWEKARALGAGLLCPGGDVKTMNLGLRELARTFDPAPAPFQTTTY